MLKKDRDIHIYNVMHPYREGEVTRGMAVSGIHIINFWLDVRPSNNIIIIILSFVVLVRRHQHGC